MQLKVNFTLRPLDLHSLLNAKFACFSVFKLSLYIIMPVLYFVSGATAQRWPGPPHSRGVYITHNDTSQSVGLLWKRHQPIAETSTWRHTTLTWDRSRCPQSRFEPTLPVSDWPQTLALDLRPGTHDALANARLLTRFSEVREWQCSIRM